MSEHTERASSHFIVIGNNIAACVAFVQISEGDIFTEGPAADAIVS